MKEKTFIIFLLATTLCFSQKYATKTGRVHFEASVPLFEDVDATNNNVVTVMNTATGDVASVALIKNFKFKTPLMEEHFNENYAESARYPKTTFSLKISGFSMAELSSAPRPCTVEGTLTFHGVSNRVNSSANIYSRDGKIYLSGKFTAKPGDYKVSIPTMLTKKIAEKVNIDYHFELAKQ